jgi:hypothetical protein
MLIESRKRLCAQVNEKDMIIM